MQVSERQIENARVTAHLLVEHRLLREMMQAMSQWLVSDLPAAALCERVALLGVALDAHARREEENLFVPLRSRSERARHLIEMMEIVHDEVRGLFDEIAVEPEPKSKLWTVIEMTEAHFDREEQELFPLAEELLGE